MVAMVSPSASWKAKLSAFLNEALSGVPSAARLTTAAKTWARSTTWLPSRRTAKGAPSSEANESIGASVPDVRMRECAARATCANATRGFMHQSATRYDHRRPSIERRCRGLPPPPFSSPSAPPGAPRDSFTNAT
jgi:hypothetical protein